MISDTQSLANGKDATNRRIVRTHVMLEYRRQQDSEIQRKGRRSAKTAPLRIRPAGQPGPATPINRGTSVVVDKSPPAPHNGEDAMLLEDEILLNQDSRNIYKESPRYGFSSARSINFGVLKPVHPYYISVTGTSRPLGQPRARELRPFCHSCPPH